jgi:WD40 repeat protein
MDVIGGGCSSDQTSENPSAHGAFLSPAKSVSAHHPTKPIIAYSQGCMIIVYDVLNDQKVNLMSHKHNIYALEFSPNGSTLLSIDFNRNAELYNSQSA